MFQSILELSTSSSKKFPESTETSHNVQRLSRASGNFQDYSESFKSVPKLSRASQNFPEYLKRSKYLKTFQSVHKLSIATVKYLKILDYKNFTGSNVLLSGLGGEN